MSIEKPLHRMNHTDHMAKADMSPDALQALFSETNYQLRESRKAVLQRYAVGNEAELLTKIRQAAVAEHPAYELYLSALILEQTRMQIRAEMLAQLVPVPDAEIPSISVHLGLKEKLQGHYASRLTEPVELAQDALMLLFDTGLGVEVRYFSPQEYSIMWRWGDAELRIDTAPTQPDCATFPRHLHGEDGIAVPDPATSAAGDCWLNLSGLLNLLLQDPLLKSLEAAPASIAHAATDGVASFRD
jgi:hypothetical protein